jgi:hypothetical protein
MKTDGDELNDNLLEKVQTCSDKNRDDDLVHCDFPTPSCLVAIQMVVFHCREEGDFDREPPKEQCSWYFESLAEISPFLAVIGKKTGYQTHGPGYGFCKKLESLDTVRTGGGEQTHSARPKSQPHNLKPNSKPKQFHVTN